MEDHNTKIDAELKPMEEQFKTIKGKERGELKKKIDALKAKKKSIPLIRALWDRGESSPTYVSLRGNPSSPVRW